MIYHKVILNINFTKVRLIITDNFEKSIEDFPLLRSFIYRLPEKKIEGIMDSVAYTCKIDTRVINDKYFMMARPGIRNSEIAHEAFHLVLRILGIRHTANGALMGNGEEIYAYMIQEAYEKIEKQIIKYRNKEVIPEPRS